MNPQVRKRQIERHCAAAIRAVAGHPRAEYRRQLLFEDGQGVELYAPHLAADVLTHSLERCRGVADAMALRLGHSDLALHRSLLPTDEVARLVFDIMEQLRVESLAPGGLVGLRRNLDQAFDDWCGECRAGGVTENELGLLIYTITQLVRSRLTGQQQDEEVEGLIEATRFKLAPLIGDELAGLRKVKRDQHAYARLALVIADAISHIAGVAGGDNAEDESVKSRLKLLTPPRHDVDDRYVEGGEPGPGEVSGGVDNRAYHYPVFSREFDREVTGASMYRLAQRSKLRHQLDRLVAAQAVSVPRLAQRLQNLFAVTDQSGWNFGEESGYLDGRRLGQLVANPGYLRVFRQQRVTPRCDTVVSFLVDNSGSMKRQRFETVAVMLDIYCRALELAGIGSEILGFTTAGWAGGQSIGAWRKAGQPDHPGRLNDRLHIVYKDVETSWRRARYSIASMLNTNHFREGLDGEALEWAAMRLRDMPYARKCLVMVSDGAPMDTATSQHNDELFLERHLKHVAHSLQRDNLIEASAIGIALDMSGFFQRSVTLDLTGTLGNREFRALDELYGESFYPR